MNLLSYRTLSLASAPLYASHLIWRGWKDPAYRERKAERFGRPPSQIRPKPIWFHAVSAGETIAAAPLIQSLADSNPSQSILVTTTTPTGSQQVQRLLEDRVDHCYVPYDIAWSVRAFLKRIRPKMLVLVETELWPELVHQTKATDANIYLINARLSEKSARGYRRLGSLARSMLSRIDGIACQYEDSRERFVELGAAKDRLWVTGNIKFDLEVTPESKQAIDQLRAQWVHKRRAWIAGSTHEPEESIVLDAHIRLRQEIGDILLILAPRHPQRCEDVVALVRDRGLKPALFSQGSDPDCDVLIVDQLGLLVNLYGVADVAFLGGSLQGTGGHNPVEAAVHGLPMLMGKDRHNFSETCLRYEQAGCLDLVTDARTLADGVGRYLNSQGLRNQTGTNARRVTEENRGARARTSTLIDDWVKNLS